MSFLFLVDLVKYFMMTATTMMMTVTIIYYDSDYHSILFIVLSILDVTRI